MPLFAAALALTIHAAEATEATAAARAHFQRAEQLSRQGQWREAIAAFEAAYRARPHPALFFNIGKCHEQLGEHAEALKNYREYLAQVPDAHDGEVVATSVRQLEQQLLETGQRVPKDRPSLLLTALPRRSSRLSTFAIVSGGVSLAAVAAGGALGLWAQGTRAELVSQVWAQERAQALHDSALGRATAANVAYAIAAAAGVTALVLILIELGSRP